MYQRFMGFIVFTFFQTKRNSLLCKSFLIILLFSALYLTFMYMLVT